METRSKVSGGSDPPEKSNRGGQTAVRTAKNLKFICMQGTGKPTRNKDCVLRTRIHKPVAVTMSSYEHYLVFSSIVYLLNTAAFC